MDQVKIGKFIARCRKEKGLTQLQLADKLGITDRAVSKWETGKAMPDSSIMLELCGILGITVNDLLSGEIVTMENYNKETERNLLEMIRQKEQADRRLLSLEVIVGVTCVFLLLALSIFAAYVQMEDGLRILLSIIALIPFLAVMPYLLKIEQTAGYYKCAKCGHRYVPTYGSVFKAMHMGRTRYMRCPKCNQKSWQKKILTKE